MIYADTTATTHPLAGGQAHENAGAIKVARGVDPREGTWQSLDEIPVDAAAMVRLAPFEAPWLVTRSDEPRFPLGSLILIDTRLSRKHSEEIGRDCGVYVQYRTGYLAARGLARISNRAGTQVATLDKACHLTSGLLLLGLQTHDDGDPITFADERKVLLALETQFGAQLVRKAFEFLKNGGLEDRLGRHNAYRLCLMYAAAQRRFRIANAHYLGRQIACNEQALRISAALDWEMAVIREAHAHFTNWNRAPFLQKDPYRHLSSRTVYDNLREQHLPRMADRLRQILLAPHVEPARRLAGQIDGLTERMGIESPSPTSFRQWLLGQFKGIESALARLILRYELEESMQTVAVTRDPRVAVAEAGAGLAPILALPTLLRGEASLTQGLSNLISADQAEARTAAQLVRNASRDLVARDLEGAYRAMREACITLEIGQAA